MISRVQPALWKFEFNLLTSPMRSQTKQVDKTGKNKNPHTFGKGDQKRREKNFSVKDFTKVSVPLLLLLQSSFLCMYHFRNHLSEEKLLGTQECKSKDGFPSSIDLSHHTNLFGIFWNVVVINHYYLVMISSILVLYLAT